MPSCVVESMRVACSIAPSAVRADRRPSSASGSTWERRAEMTANSAATKNALTASSSTSQNRPAQSFTAPPRRRGEGATSTDGSARKRSRSIRLPSSRRTSSSPCSVRTRSPTFGSRPSSLTTKPATVSYRPLSGTRTPAWSASSSGRRMPGKVNESRPRTTPGPGAVVLVDEVADELLHEVLEGGDAGGAAVLVDDDGHLVATAAQLPEQRVEGDGLRHPEGLRLDGADRHLGPSVARDRHRLLHVHEPDDVVDAVVARHREAGEAGAPRELEDVRRGRRARDDGQPGPRRHHVGGGVAGEAERAGEQRRGVAVEHALHGAAAYERGELLGAAGAGELLLRLDADDAQHGVGGAVRAGRRRAGRPR